MENLLKIIEARHSARDLFDPHKLVPGRDVKKVLEAGRWAPTAHNMQNFEIIVVDNPQVLDRLGKITTRPSPEFIRENFEQLSMTEAELREKKVGILGLQFPSEWRDRAKLEQAVQDAAPGTLDQTIKGSPALLVVVYDTRKRAPASVGDVLGILSLGCLMENMWLMAEELGVGFQIMSVFAGPIQADIKKVLRVPEYMAISFAVRLGYPVTQSRYLRVRREIGSFAHANAYGKKFE
jgi:nitroreductase